jgi:hypothetical protein
MDQASIGEVRGRVEVLPEYGTNCARGRLQLQRNLEDSGLNAGENTVSRLRYAAKQVQRLGDDGLAGNQRIRQSGVNAKADAVARLVVVVDGYKKARVDKHRPHRARPPATLSAELRFVGIAVGGLGRLRPKLFWPKSFICFLFVARSAIPLSNIPAPISIRGG